MLIGTDYIVCKTGVLVIKVYILQKENVMPLTLNSFVQAKPDHVPVKVFLPANKVESLTRGERLLRKAGKLPGFRSGMFMTRLRAGEDTAWREFRYEFCEEFGVGYQQFGEYCVELGMVNKPLTPLAARKIIRMHQAHCRNHPHPDCSDAATQAEENILPSLRDSGGQNTEYDKPEHIYQVC
ncbi:hypothetical protein SEEB0220_04860 [Salmonella enterica subsp. enterica serovar Bareilly str. CFSAN000220]|uniref:Uncharacterized protein n=2 Tax=Salmonella enterica TaxID=28901 RepID=A0A5U9SSJ4_SALET|nr:hypothetical protein [Salmonella enterica subsp. enterica serovar Bareilly]ECE0372015.1 hypothetical protein [Salmonella enterica subsp. enterica serovar Hvittingfoss]KGE49320.1 hypothetical protein SEEB0220_04860 [Salmonella enterica subsp. enterica serovar Bareilly str. CFSAN000220]